TRNDRGRCRSVEMTPPEPKKPRLPVGMLLHVAITPNRGIIIQPPVTIGGGRVGVDYLRCCGSGPWVFVGDFYWWRQASLPVICWFLYLPR
ncbi:MAG: hypothetical protein ACYDHG_18830, partial [Desulfomonilaceae bacterium]